MPAVKWFGWVSTFVWQPHRLLQLITVSTCLSRVLTHLGSEAVFYYQYHVLSLLMDCPSSPLLFTCTRLALWGLLDWVWCLLFPFFHWGHRCRVGRWSSVVPLGTRTQVEARWCGSGARVSSSPAQPGNHLLERHLGGVESPSALMWGRRSSWPCPTCILTHHSDSPLVVMGMERHVAVRVGGLAVNTCGRPVVGPGHLDIYTGMLDCSIHAPQWT